MVVENYSTISAESRAEITPIESKCITALLSYT
jgi:hypothetical protein